MGKRKLIALAAVCVMAAGIVSSEAQPSVSLNFGNPGSPWAPNTMMVAPTLPPPPWSQPVPAPPGPGMVWVDGNWAWNGSASGGAWTWFREPGRNRRDPGQGGLPATGIGIVGFGARVLAGLAVVGVKVLPGRGVLPARGNEAAMRNAERDPRSTRVCA